MRRMFLLLAAALPLLADIPLPPAPTRYVTDAADVLPDDREAVLNETLAQHDRETSDQVLVYIGRRVPAGTTLEEMGPEAMRRWRVGQEAKDNGAILFLFVDDRASRIDVGYGFEHLLTDARSKQILVDLRPALREGDYAAAAELGARAILETIRSSPPEQAAYDTRAAVEARAAEIAAREEKLLIPAAIFGVLLFGFLFYALYRAFIVGDWKFGGSSRGSFGSSSSSSSSSSSGFSGGGGSGGGGGASDKW